MSKRDLKKYLTELNKMQLEENKKKNSKMAFDVLQQQTQK